MFSRRPAHQYRQPRGIRRDRGGRRILGGFRGSPPGRRVVGAVGPHRQPSRRHQRSPHRGLRADPHRHRFPQSVLARSLLSMTMEEMLEQVRSLPDGHYAECGVYRGESAERIWRHMPPGMELWLFDSCQGHAEPTEFDNAKTHPKGAYADTSVEVIRSRVPQAKLVPGYLPGTLSQVPSGHLFRFVNIDCDHYIPTRGATEFFLPRMVQGGIIRFDDLCDPQGCPGAVKAVHEFINPKLLHKNDWYYVKE